MCKWIVVIGYSYDKLGATFNATQISGKLVNWMEKISVQDIFPNSKKARFWQQSHSELLGQGIERCNFLLISGTSKTGGMEVTIQGWMGWDENDPFFGRAPEYVTLLKSIRLGAVGFFKELGV